MKKFIITEEEKNRILGMHEDHGYNSLNEQNNGVGFGSDAKKNIEVLKAQAAQAQAAQAQVKAPEETSGAESLPWNKPDPTVAAETTGQVVQGDKGDPYEYKKEGGYYYVRKKGAKDWIFTRGNTASAVAKKFTSQVQPVAKPALKPAGTSTPNTTGSSIGVIYQYEYPNDKKYRYGVKDKKWFGKNLANGKEFDLSTITTTIANLNNTFPNAMEEEPLQAAKPVTPNPETATAGVVQEPATKTAAATTAAAPKQA